MRIMDADKYCDFLNKYPLEIAQSNFMTFYREALQHTFECEVEAIPIEWLEKCKDRYILCCTIIDDIIEEWREENE